MKRLLEQLNAIEAIVDTVNPAQIEQDAVSVANRYETYARSYNLLDRVHKLFKNLIEEIEKGKPVNGYLSADYGYGKTATLIYLWYECQQNQIMAVPPFKFKELENLMTATYGWLKVQIPTKFLPEFENIYHRYSLKSQQEQAIEVASKFKISEKKALQIVQQLKTNRIDSETILGFWQESVTLIQKVGMKGLVIFADESQEFLRTEEGSSVRIQILSDLVKGMRALSVPVALIIGMPTVPTESAIEEQAGDIIHRMKEQKISLQLADAYDAKFPIQLWKFLCDKFLDDQQQATQLAHQATLESLAQLCERKDLSNGPRTTIEIFKRIVQFVREHHCPYTPFNLIEDYLTGQVQFYGSGQHRINHTVNTLEKLPSVQQYPSGQQLIRLLAMFPAGLSESFAKDLGVLESLLELVDDDNLYGVHIIQLSWDRYALTALAQAHTPTVVDQILNQFRQRWFRDWNDNQKKDRGSEIFRAEIMPLLFSHSRSGQKANWTWRYHQEWQEDRFGFYNFLEGAPERHYAQFPNRSLVVSVGFEDSGLMKFDTPIETHLDWRFYLSYNVENELKTQRLMAIAGTGQVDFHLDLNRSFEVEYPKSFGLLNKVIPPKQCSACTLLNLSYYIQDWLVKHPEVSKADQERLQQHRRECHRYALRLLFPSTSEDNWSIEGLDNIQGTETRFIESVFYQKCQQIFPEYQSFYNNLQPTLLKYKSALEKVPLVFRRGHQIYSVNKTDMESLFKTTGSGLPSILGILKANFLISDEKIAGKKEDNSQVKFVQHPLEILIHNQLQRLVKIQPINPEKETQAINFQKLWKFVKRLGYLQEEFEEAIEWLQLRRYVEWDRQAEMLTLANSEVNPDILRTHLDKLRNQLSPWLKIFEDKLLSKITSHLNNIDIKLQETVAILVGDGNLNQLNIFNQPLQNLDEKQSLAEVALDDLYRKIQEIEQQFENFYQQKLAGLREDLSRVKTRTKTLCRDLKISKVSQLMVSHSGLEVCLDNYRKVLEKQVIQLEENCNSLTQSIVLEQSDLIELYYQREQSSQLLGAYEVNHQELSALVAGLEQWRIILTRAEVLRNNITNNPEQLRRYEDDFVDRIVTYFSNHQVEGFKEYERLQSPLLELEEQLQSEKQSRREAFNQVLKQYETLLEQISGHKSSLSKLCRFDDEDRQGSYNTIRQVFSEKLQKQCDRLLLQWDKLEQDLIFCVQERGQNVTQLLNQVHHFQEKLRESIKKLPELIENITALATQIGIVNAITLEGQKLQEESIRIQNLKDKNITPKEQQLIDKISDTKTGVSISQLRHLMSENDEIWEDIQNLYRKGHLEIIVNRRE